MKLWFAEKANFFLMGEWNDAMENLILWLTATEVGFCCVGFFFFFVMLDINHIFCM